jgi:hypothetical protein
MILPRTPDESLVVDIARGLDSGSMVEQAHRILMQVSYSVGYRLLMIGTFITSEGESLKNLS